MIPKRLTGFLKSAFLRKTRVEDVPENFSTIETKNDSGQPLIGIFNAAYQTGNYDTRFSWCVRLQIKLSPFEIDQNGLPYDHEARMAHRMEQLFIISLRNRLKAYYMGHLFREGVFEIWWYAKNVDKVRSYLDVEISRKEVPRELSYQIVSDPEWALVKPYIELCEDIFSS
jgi:Family of unknown function (DUF695)